MLTTARRALLAREGKPTAAPYNRDVIQEHKWDQTGRLAEQTGHHGVRCLHCVVRLEAARRRNGPCSRGSHSRRMGSPPVTDHAPPPARDGQDAWHRVRRAASRGGRPSHLRELAGAAHPGRYRRRSGHPRRRHALPPRLGCFALCPSHRGALGRRTTRRPERPHRDPCGAAAGRRGRAAHGRRVAHSPAGQR